MNRTATVQFEPDDDSAATRTVATGTFVVDEGLASNPIQTFLLRLPFNIPEAGEFTLESAVVARTDNTSLSVRRTSEPAEGLFLAGFVWKGGFNPYFGVRIPAVGSIHIYLAT
jgi:hypothetical protein